MRARAVAVVVAVAFGAIAVVPVTEVQQEQQRAAVPDSSPAIAAAAHQPAVEERPACSAAAFAAAPAPPSWVSTPGAAGAVAVSHPTSWVARSDGTMIVLGPSDGELVVVTVADMPRERRTWDELAAMIEGSGKTVTGRWAAGGDGCVFSVASEGAAGDLAFRHHGTHTTIVVATYAAGSADATRAVARTVVASALRLA